MLNKLQVPTTPRGHSLLFCFSFINLSLVSLMCRATNADPLESTLGVAFASQAGASTGSLR